MWQVGYSLINSDFEKKALEWGTEPMLNLIYNDELV